MAGKLSKEFCMGCKRIIAQNPVTGGNPIIPVMCKRCAEEIKEMMQVYEAQYGWRPYWVTTEEEMIRAKAIA